MVRGQISRHSPNKCTVVKIILSGLISKHKNSKSIWQLTLGKATKFVSKENGGTLEDKLV